MEVKEFRSTTVNMRKILPTIILEKVKEDEQQQKFSLTILNIKMFIKKKIQSQHIN